MSRIQSFLLREEIDEAQISYTPDKENVINYEQVDLGWTENQSEKCLTGLNFFRLLSVKEKTKLIFCLILK